MEISSIDYIKSLNFDYIETYSFQRGRDYEENSKILKSEYNKLKVRKEKRNNLADEEEKRYSGLNDLLGFTQYLINTKGEFHRSSKKTNSFKRDDPAANRLIDILKTEIIEIPMWMCGPTYRDGIVFYDKNGKIISALNVCLSCERMELEPLVIINGDEKTYGLLRQFFIDCGHEIELDKIAVTNNSFANSALATTTSTKEELD